MVTKYGMSSKLVMLFVDEKEKFGGEITKTVDDEVNDLLAQSYHRAKALLEGHRKELEQVAMGLVEHETLSGAELVDLINGKKISGGTKRSQKPSCELKAVTNRPRTSSVPAPVANSPPSNANKVPAAATANKSKPSTSNSSVGPTEEAPRLRHRSRPARAARAAPRRPRVMRAQAAASLLGCGETPSLAAFLVGSRRLRPQLLQLSPGRRQAPQIANRKPTLP